MKDDLVPIDRGAVPKGQCLSRSLLVDPIKVTRGRPLYSRRQSGLRSWKVKQEACIAAQTARSRCKVLQYVYYFRVYQRQMTLHGVGVITKLYFAIFAAFKESMTLNLAQRSLKVIHFGGNRKPVYDFI